MGNWVVLLGEQNIRCEVMNAFFAVLFSFCVVFMFAATTTNYIRNQHELVRRWGAL